MQKITLWIQDMDNKWIRVEAYSCYSSSLKALACLGLSFKPRPTSSDPIYENLETNKPRLWFDLSAASLVPWVTLFVDGLVSSFSHLQLLHIQPSAFSFVRGISQIRNFATSCTLTFPQAACSDRANQKADISCARNLLSALAPPALHEIKTGRKPELVITLFLMNPGVMH